MADPFELLGLEARFELDLAALEARQRDLSRALHPDRYAGRGTAERRQALSRAIEVNEAVRLMKDPIRRAEALLARHGVHLHETDAGAQPSQAFLMDVLELREELGNAQRRSDLAKVGQLAQSFRASETKLLRDLAESFAVLPPNQKWEPNEVKAVTHKLGELRYLRRLLDEANAIQDELG